MTFTLGANSISVNGSLYPSTFEYHKHQLAGEAADGTPMVRSRSVEAYTMTVSLDEHNNFSDIRDFFKDTVKLRKAQFTFVPDADQNAGAGDGSAVLARYWSSNFIEERIANNRSGYELVLRIYL